MVAMQTGYSQLSGVETMRIRDGLHWLIPLLIVREFDVVGERCKKYARRQQHGDCEYDCKKATL
jgi:hypothetical protein